MKRFTVNMAISGAVLLIVFIAGWSVARLIYTCSQPDPTEVAFRPPQVWVVPTRTTPAVMSDEFKIALSNKATDRMNVYDRECDQAKDAADAFNCRIIQINQVSNVVTGKWHRLSMMTDAYGEPWHSEFSSLFNYENKDSWYMNCRKSPRTTDMDELYGILACQVRADVYLDGFAELYQAGQSKRAKP